MGVRGRSQNNFAAKYTVDGYTLPSTNKELLNECNVDVYRSSGPGGQSVNTTNSAVRLRHIPTGVTISTQDERSQTRNLEKGLERLRQRIEKLQYQKPKRHATKPSHSAVQARLQEKKQHSHKKAQRGKEFFND